MVEREKTVRKVTRPSPAEGLSKLLQNIEKDMSRTIKLEKPRVKRPEEYFKIRKPRTE